jgi:hypothetical protein
MTGIWIRSENQRDIANNQECETVRIFSDRRPSGHSLDVRSASPESVSYGSTSIMLLYGSRWRPGILCQKAVKLPNPGSVHQSSGRRPGAASFPCIIYPRTRTQIFMIRKQLRSRFCRLWRACLRDSEKVNCRMNWMQTAGQDIKQQLADVRALK